MNRMWRMVTQLKLKKLIEVLHKRFAGVNDSNTAYDDYE